MQMDLFAEHEDDLFELDRLDAETKLLAKMDPYLGPLVPMGWDASLGLKKGDLVRHVRCPKCGVLAFNAYLLETNTCLCAQRSQPAHVQLEPGLNGWKKGSDGGRIFGLVWSEDSGWLVPECRGYLTGRTWEFQASWNDYLKQWELHQELVL